MIERFIPVAITTQDQLAQHVTSGRLGYSLQPHFTQQMGEMRWQYAPTHEARDPWPGERLFEHSLWTDDRFALTNERPLTGRARKLARHSIIMAQQIASPKHLAAEEPRTYIGVVPRKNTSLEIIEYVGAGEVEQLAIRGLFSYLQDENVQFATMSYHKRAFDLQRLIADRQKEYEHAEANRIITPEFLASIPMTASGLGELWEEKHQAKYGMGATDESKADAEVFFKAMKFIGLHGHSDSLKHWHAWAFQSGARYNEDHDAITQRRLDTLHGDYEAVMRAIREKGHFFTHEEYRSLNPGRPGY